jgi:gas vesicle protein
MLDEKVVAALVALVGIVIGALPTYLFMRQRGEAEIDKLKAETDKLKAETEKIRNDLQNTKLELKNTQSPIDNYHKFLEIGMEAIHDHLTDDNLRPRLAKARKIKVLKTWFPESVQIEDGLISAIKQGATVELLLCKPESKILKERCKSAGAEDCYTWVYRAVKKVYESMIEKGNRNINIVLYDSWPGCPVIWCDKETLMGFYFRGKSSPRWPWVSVKADTPLAITLDEQYNELKSLPENVRLDSSDKMAKWLADNKKWEKPKIKSD